MHRFIIGLGLLLVLGACKQKSLLVTPPEFSASFILETPMDGEVEITASSLDQIRFLNYETHNEIQNGPGRSLVMFVEYTDVVTNMGEEAGFSFMIRKREQDQSLFSLSANGEFDIYTDPQDFIDRVLSPSSTSDNREYWLNVYYSNLSIVGVGTASSVQIESAEVINSPNGDQLVQVSGQFALPIGGLYDYLNVGDYATKEGQFSFTVNLSEIY